MPPRSWKRTAIWKSLKAFGTAPYDFSDVMLTSRGRFEAERLEESATDSATSPVPVPQATGGPATGNDRPQSTVTRFAHAVGSPFGFTAVDWEAVGLDHEDASRLIVVFGHQWEPTYFDSPRLRAAIEAKCQAALTAALTRTQREVALDFRVLAGGYGSHLFNQIARDVIASDIAVFETSDRNSNVMIEMGVALTWGTRVHPIRRYDAPPLPSDVSGQKWALYRADGSVWEDAEHESRTHENGGIGLPAQAQTGVGGETAHEAPRIRRLAAPPVRPR